MVPEQTIGVDVQLFLKKYDYNIFSHTQRVLDKKNFVSKSFFSLRFSFLQFTKGLLREKIIPPPHSTPLHRLPPTLASRLCYGRARTLTQHSNARVRWMIRVAPKPPSLRAPFKRVPGFPGKVCISLPTFPCPAPNMVRRWPVRRVNETKALGDAPQVPISSHPRFRRVVTRHQSQIRAHSLRCLVTLEAENGR